MWLKSLLVRSLSVRGIKCLGFSIGKDYIKTGNKFIINTGTNIVYTVYCVYTFYTIRY